MTQVSNLIAEVTTTADADTERVFILRDEQVTLSFELTAEEARVLVVHLTANEAERIGRALLEAAGEAKLTRGGAVFIERDPDTTVNAGYSR